jgi:nicotinamidase/pyrazinamidase
MRIDPDTDILGVIDVQPTFMPGGELPVPDGDAILPALNRLLTGPFRRAFATQDWHPADHMSFASRHPGLAPFESITMPYGLQTLWPDHAIQGSANAALHPALETRRLQLILRKGMDPAIDSYSAFVENDRQTRTGLAAWLSATGAQRVFLAGLAADYCIAWTAEHAVAAGFSTVIIEDVTRGIGLPTAEGATTMQRARERLQTLGVQFASADTLS